MVSQSVPKKIPERAKAQAALVIQEELDREQKIQWFQQYLDGRKAELAAHETELETLQTIVSGLRASILMHTQLLDELRAGQESDSGIFLENKVAVSPASSQQRNPTEMLRSEYKGMKLSDIIVDVLRHQSPLTTTELCRIIYDSRSREEFSRSRNSLSTELRSGAKAVDPKWRKLGRNAYAAL